MKEESSDYILLKWGTLKAWSFHNSPESFEYFKKYASFGQSYGAMTQRDTIEQKELLLKMIDTLNGEVQNDWTGEIYENKEDAKKYIMEYNDPNTPT